MEDFTSRRDALVHLGTWVEMLVKHLLREKGIRLHSVNCRVKDAKSLEKKLASKEEKYESLDDVTDCLGLRVITYFEDDVDKVASLIADNFDVDHIVDRRSGRGGDPEKFGYQSLHYVVRITADRAQLPEWAAMKTQLFEVQLRSILQHAWAEVEHDLGYKAEEEVPATSRRRFSRLSGLLETADAEFIGIRDELNAYRGAVADSVSTDPGSVAVDRDSVRAFVLENPRVAAADRKVAKAASRRLAGAALPATMDRRVAEFRLLGLKTLGEVEAALADNERTIGELAHEFKTATGGEGVLMPRGISLMYLGYVLFVVRAGTWLEVRRELLASGRTEDLSNSLQRRLRVAWTRMRADQPALPGPKTLRTLARK